MRRFTLTTAAIVALIGCDNKEAPKTAGSSEASTPMSGGESKDPTKTGDNKEHVKTPETKDHSTGASSKHPWGSFKQGSFTKMKTISEVEVGGTKHKTESTMTYTLKDVTADEAIVETEMVMANGAPQMHEMKIPLKAPERKAASDAPKVKSGTEEITVAGKKMKCHWTEMETDAGGTKATTMVFTNEEVPGFTVKTIIRGSTMTSTTEVVEYSSK